MHIFKHSSTLTKIIKNGFYYLDSLLIIILKMQIPASYFKLNYKYYLYFFYKKDYIFDPKLQIMKKLFFKL